MGRVPDATASRTVRHGSASLNDGAVGTGLTTVTTGGMGVNAIFRVSGDVLQENVPVELIDFTIDKEE